MSRVPLLDYIWQEIIYMALVDDVIKLMGKAGAGILDIYERSGQFKVQVKADNSPLTQADLVAHDILSKGLQKLTPDIPILSEEECQIPFSTRSKWKRYWLVDPLDGTREFIRRSGEFVVNVALIENHQPVLGVIYLPVYESTYFAEKNGGSFKQTNKIRTRIHTRSWQRDQTKILASRGMKREKIDAKLGDKLGHYELILSGSAIKFCRIAEGLADFYPRFGNTCEWDTASGQIILEEAGGALVDLSWQPFRYNVQSSLLNSHFVAVGDKKLIKVLQENL